MAGFLRDLMARLRRRPPAPVVRVADEGMSLLDGDRLCERFAWGEVREVVAFKRDLGTYDEIRLAFRLDRGWVEVGEGDEGWSDLLAAVGRHFPTVPPDWYWSVMLPPFATCYRVLYERARPDAASDPGRSP